MITNNTTVGKDLYSKFSKVDYSSNRNYLQNVYGNNNSKVVYYNDPKKEKKKKIKNAVLIGTSAFTALAAIAFAIRRKSFNFSGMKKTTMGFLEKAGNASVNFTNLKDDAWDRFATYLSDKTPFGFIKKYGDKFSDWYRGNVHKALEGKYKAAQKAIIDAGGDFKLKDFNEVFNGLDNSIKKVAQGDRITSRKNLTAGEHGKLKNLMENLVSPLTDNKISDAVRENADILKIPEGASENLKKAIEHYNNLQQNSLIPKLRDINYGCAPTDILTVGGPVLAFCAAVGSEKDKEERKSLLFNLGIPLLPTLMMPIIGTIFPILNGPRALLAGFAVGQAVSQSVKYADAKLRERKLETKA